MWDLVAQEVVDAAVTNADRYYRTMAGPGNAPAAESASAFRAVCAAWHAQREKAAEVLLLFSFT